MKNKRISLITLFICLFVITSNVFAASNDNPSLPNIYAKAAITIDVKTGEIIYTKDIDKKMYPASTTKLLTALLLAENKKKDDAIPYTAEAKKQPEYSLNKNIHPVDLNETMKANDVMDGLLLFSGNDVAYMISDSVAGNSKNFENMMNNKIKELHLKNTHFVTPNGLHNDNHYTTPYDLSVIGRTALKNQWVYNSSHKKDSIVSTSKGTKMPIKNRNKLLGEDGCIAGKTGFTNAAGRCLVALFERNGRQLLGVVMGSVYDAQDSFVFNDMKKIIDWSYNTKPSCLYKKGSTLNTKKITYKPLGFVGPSKTIEVPLMLQEDVLYYKNDINDREIKKSFNIENTSFNALCGKKSIGTLTIQERETKKTYSLYSSLSSKQIFKYNMPFYIAIIIALIVIVAIAFLLFKLKHNLKRKRNKKKNKYWY